MRPRECFCAGCWCFRFSWGGVMRQALSQRSRGRNRKRSSALVGVPKSGHVEYARVPNCAAHVKYRWWREVWRRFSSGAPSLVGKRQQGGSRGCAGQDKWASCLTGPVVSSSPWMKICLSAKRCASRVPRGSARAAPSAPVFPNRLHNSIPFSEIPPIRIGQGASTGATCLSRGHNYVLAQKD